MSLRRVRVIGAGKRVREAALPAFAALPHRFELAGLHARSARELEAGGRTYPVTTLDSLTAQEVAETDLFYLAVGKDAVPAVLTHLTSFDVSRADLLIDTPVVRFKHFGHARLAQAFRDAWVSEDCVTLPWIDTVLAAVAGGAIGRPRTALFLQSGYAYHAVATAKAVLRGKAVTVATRTKLAGGGALRRMRFARGTRALVLEPRDYAVGRFALLGRSGVIADWDCRADPRLPYLGPDARDVARHPAWYGAQRLAPVVEDGAWTGFRIGDVETRLDEAEVELLRGGDVDASVVARMDDLKRVGFYRLLRRIAAGEGAWPLLEGLDDMVVDYHLEKLGRYVANPLTSARSGLARVLLGAATRLASR